MWETVESTNERIGCGNNSITSGEPPEAILLIDWILIRRSLELSSANPNDRLLERKREASYPPNVRLPRALLRPGTVVCKFRGYVRTNMLAYDMEPPPYIHRTN